MSSARDASLRVVLTAIGSRGDVQPMVAIAQALAARGHRALIAAPPDFGPWVRSLGFAFAGLGIDMNAFLQEHRHVLGRDITKFFSLTRRLFDDELPRQMDTLLAVAHDADAIVFSPGSAMVPSTGTKLGIPVLGVLYTSAMMPSAQYPPVIVPWRRLPRWLNRLLWFFVDPLWNRMMRDGLNEARRRHGMPPVRDAMKHFHEGAPFVLAVDAAFMPADPEWAERVPPVGFLFLHDANATLDPELEAWLAQGDSPIYVGFGSMTGPGPDRMRRVMVEAIQATGRRALVSRGWANLGDDLPAGWRVTGDVPHSLLFPRMACVIHHGGSGTTASALRAGVPQLALPLILDQYHHAQRLYEEGLAPRPVAMEHIDAPQLAAAIRETMAIAPEARLRIARRLRESDAAGDIARRVEALVRSRRPP